MFSKPSAIPPNYAPEHAAKATSPFAGIAYHNLQRKSAIVHASAINHGKDVFLVTNDYFDLSKTIFASVTGKLGLKRVILKARLGNEPCWKNEVKEKIEKEFEEFSQAKENRIILSPKHNQEILHFMESECNFLCEHADGSFMDHLHFCHDYAAVHYTQQSPRVLFLHSILGVGTNIFPMTVDKIDKLRSMLKPDEFKHIEAFPSILRLVNCQTLTNELLDKHRKNELHKLERISFHRVIDNKPLELTADDLWIAMNYQMVHQLDFLPCTNWKTEMNDPLFQVFVELYTLLTESGKLVANVNLDLKNSCEKDEFGMPVTLASLISKAVPKNLKRKETISSMVNFSKVIGHDVGYSIIWAK